MAATALTSPRSRSRSFRSCLGVFALALLAVVGRAAESRYFDIPAGEAVATLKQFAAQTGQQVIFPPSAVAGIRTRALTGTLPPVEALTRLLAGTGLSFVRDEQSGAFAIRAAAPSAQAAPPLPATAVEEVLALSPFVVQANSDQGYVATQTLSGTRLRSSLEDVTAAIDVMTPDFLADIGATNLNDALEFGVNSATMNGSFITEPSGLALTDFSNNLQFQIRGFPSQSVTRDFFQTVVKPDVYNSSRLTMSRGPNAILYGIGSPAGVIDSSSSRPLLNSAKNQVTVKTDNNGSRRATFDFNRPLVKNKLAIRLAGMTEDRVGWRTNDEAADDRIYLALSAKLGTGTELTTTYEKGSSSSLYSPPWPAFNGFQVWQDAGSQLEATVGAIAAATGIPAKGITRLSANPYLVDASFGPAGRAIPVLSWRRMGTSDSRSASAILSRNFSLTDERVIPFDVNVVGGAKRLDQKFESYSVFVNQRVAQNLNFEFAYNHQDSTKDAWSGLAGGQQPNIRVDVNAKLPNGATNPNAGLYYFESTNVSVLSRDITEQQDSLRLSASLTVDLRSRKSWLGQHDLAGMIERVERENIIPSLDLINTSPAAYNSANGLTGATAFPEDFTNVLNKVKARYYINPAARALSAPFPTLSQYPTLFSGNALPTANATGYTPALAAVREQSNAFNRVDSLMGVFLSRFWDGRIITTLGARRDAQSIWIADRVLGADGLYKNPHTLSARDYAVKREAGTTFTKGIVFKATDYLSFTAGTSDSFQPNGDVKNIFGELLGPTTANGYDVGARVKLLAGKLYFGANYFDTKSKATPSPFVRTLGGNIRGSIDRAWSAIAAYEKNAIYLQAPYNEQSAWSGVLDQNSKGVELTLTGNPTTQWRFKLSVTQQQAVLTKFGRRIQDYIVFVTPLIEARPDWLALASGTNTTVATDLAEMKIIAARKAAFNGVKNTTQPEWAANLVSNYTFGNGPLKGFGLGQSARFRKASGIGYAENPATQSFITSQPFYGKDQLVFGAWVSYRRKLGPKTNLTLQLNIDNVLGEGPLNPHEALDDGTGKPVITRYTLIEPRRYSLSATFDF